MLKFETTAFSFRNMTEDSERDKRTTQTTGSANFYHLLRLPVGVALILSEIFSFLAYRTVVNSNT